MRQYYAAIGWADRPTALTDFRSVGTSHGEILIGGLNLPDTAAIVTVRAVNNANEYADVQLPIGVDTTAPICSPIAINENAPGQLMQYTEEVGRINASWSCHDASPWEHRPITCRWAVGSYSGGDDLMPWCPAEASGEHSFGCDDCLENGFIYYVSLVSTPFAVPSPTPRTRLCMECSAHKRVLVLLISALF